MTQELYYTLGYWWHEGNLFACNPGLKRYFVIPKDCKKIRIHAVKRKTPNSVKAKRITGTYDAITRIEINANRSYSAFRGLSWFVREANAQGKYYFWIELL